MIFRVEPGGVLRLVQVCPNDGTAPSASLAEYLATWIREAQHESERLGVSGHADAEFIALAGVRSRVHIELRGDPEKRAASR